MSQFKFGFGSDNQAGVHPDILASLAAVNEAHAPAYGMDHVTARAESVLRRHFGEKAEVYFVFNGTAANVTALATCTKSFSSILCAETSHLHNDECGAPEKFLGCKLHAIPTPDGKLSPESLQPYLVRKGDQHCSQPHAVTITQPTEMGTVYSLEELRSICQFAHDNGLYVHVDGARLVNAATHLGVGLRALTSDVGVDVLSFGGTKNGLLCGEAVIFFRPELAQNYRYLRKQAMNLPSKSRFIAAQFMAWLEGDLWQRISRHSLDMATYLREALTDIPFVRITQATQSNGVFAQLPPKLVSPLREHSFFYVWDEQTFEVRLMCSFDTSKAQIDAFAAEVRRLGAEMGLSARDLKATL